MINKISSLTYQNSRNHNQKMPGKSMSFGVLHYSIKLNSKIFKGEPQKNFISNRLVGALEKFKIIELIDNFQRKGFDKYTELGIIGTLKPKGIGTGVKISRTYDTGDFLEEEYVIVKGNRNKKLFDKIFDIVSKEIDRLNAK